MGAAMPTGAVPLPAERAEALAPFVEAALATLRDWAGAEGFAAAQWLGPLPAAADACVVALELRRTSPGRLCVAMPRGFAAALAERVFAEVGDPGDASLAADCVGEFANLVAGHAKALTQGTPAHFNLGTPHAAKAPAEPLAVALLKCELGELLLGIA